MIRSRGHDITFLYKNSNNFLYLIIIYKEIIFQLIFLIFILIFNLIFFILYFIYLS